MIAAVQRDLEDLLNTRESHMGMPLEFDEVRNSIAAYGLPDLTSLNAITPQQRVEVGRILEEVVRKFEPRLRQVRATLMEAGDGKERNVRFRIDARLNVDPAPEVAFETILELTTGHYTVHSSSA
jgi:type VI secretion system protein ImpF